MESYIGKREVLVNAERGLYTFAVVELIEEDVALIQQYLDDLLNASLLSTS